ncbi:DNA polymerase III subunit delta [Sphingomonas sp. 37zxx]|uniref:DNA polymerase III subunit delta n=1 Tax=Sphingomonas sp. 37zxx TaxID=1550073 RepID=UPI000B075774
MNLKPQAMRARLEAPDADTRLYLLHGPDEASANELAGRLAKSLGDGAERVDFDGGFLKNNPGRLADEAASMSLFGDRRYIRVSGAGEECLEAFTLLLAAERAGNPVVAIAPTVKKSGKIVKLAEGARTAAACAFYVPEGQEAVRMVQGIARDHGLRLGAHVGERLLAATGGDRAILAQEIEKLALFVDASPDNPIDADLDAIEAIGADLDESGMFAAIEAVIGGDAPGAAAALHLVSAENANIPMLRQLVRRLMALAEMRREVDGGEGIEAVVERNRVFWKEKPNVVKALRKWSSPQLARAIDRVRAAERAIVAPSNAGTILAEGECLAIARAAARFG